MKSEKSSPSLEISQLSLALMKNTIKKVNIPLFPFYSSPNSLTDTSTMVMPGAKGDASILKPTVMTGIFEL